MNGYANLMNGNPSKWFCAPIYRSQNHPSQDILAPIPRPELSNITIARAILASSALHAVILWCFIGWNMSADQPLTDFSKNSRLEAKLVSNIQTNLLKLESATLVSTQVPGSEQSAIEPPLRPIDAAAKSGIPTPALRQSLPTEVSTIGAPIFDIEIEPNYPIELLARGMRGAVTALFKVGSEGKLEVIEILDSRPSGAFDGAVIAAITSAKLRAGSTKKGSQLMITVVFDASGTKPQGQIIQFP